MIPVRVPAELKVTTVGGVRTLPPDSQLHGEPCPACGDPLHIRPIVLVAIGISPEDRKPGGYTTGGAVAVHADCAGTPDDEMDE